MHRRFLPRKSFGQTIKHGDIVKRLWNRGDSPSDGHILDWGYPYSVLERAIEVETSVIQRC